MAASLNQGTGDLSEVHEINVTPFIDVILVLLIIFMVAAPLATVDIAVDLPASNAQPQPRPDKPVYLTVKPDLSLSVGNETVGRGALPGALDASTGGQKDTRIFLRADKLVPYGEVMQVMNMLRAAGYLKVALVGMEQASSP
ncbi:TonB system transport protein ExbD [Bradyrhizobium sp. 157]|jgi:biopolymer transport protein ExbD|uniref:TonB system transport protein ExbD n=1 Tax=Bradyrhizobium sp. 157 TaxID=2782631 RepID=UPI001FFAE390|nr:TonB system transport protein ExbD [Bradyrhizobium sp. 157]MCK1641754.1 TonB system transport protein ExbD [Bradyrhizobium sp. 157]